MLLWSIRAYKLAISPLLPSACRFQPTCSQYAYQAIERFGAARGSWLALRRLFRCTPFSAAGYDPVPPADDAAVRDEAIVSRETSAHSGGAALASKEA
jgi:putative membrane protein insertion efficiency factor